MQSQTQDWVAKLSDGGSGQAAALSELRNLLRKRLRRSLGSNPRADEAFIEDVVQDALVKILDVLDQFQGRSKFTTWATSIAIRLAITEMRRLRWKDTSLDQLMEHQATEAPGFSTAASAEGGYGNAELIAEMYKIINEELSEKQRTALLAELQGMPQEEIGRRTGSNRNAIYKVTHDARKRLKKGLVAAGFSAADLVSFQGGAR